MEYSVKDLKKIAKEIRIDVLRSIYEAKSGHPGGSLSSVDLMTALYFKVANLKSADDPLRDRIIFSKGHVAPLLYALLAHKGFIKKEELLTLRKFGSRLQGHPKKDSLPGIEASTGSLGQGISIAVGIAYAAKMDGKDIRVYTLLGDGEIQEGQVWEGFMSAGHFKLDNLCAIIDYNKLQIDGNVEDVMGILPLKDKLESFRWHAVEIDGHNMDEILKAFDEAKNTKGKPTVIIAHTVKGKGVSFMENIAGWHGKAPSKDELETAVNGLKDLED